MVGLPMLRNKAKGREFPVVSCRLSAGPGQGQTCKTKPIERGQGLRVEGLTGPGGGERA